MATAGEGTPAKSADPTPDPGSQKWLFWMTVVDRTAGVLKACVKYGIWIPIAYYAKESIVALAGKLTVTSIGFSVLAEFGEYRLPPWIMAIICLLYALRERKERLRKTEKLSGRISQLELRLDPNRTSSGLTATGETNERDRP